MRSITANCPHCSSTHQYFLRNDDDRHLRQCPDCNGWFVLSKPLDDLDPTPVIGGECPVTGCEEPVEEDALPEHVIAEHGAALEPDRS